MLKKLSLVLFLLCISYLTFSQCGSLIASFPYFENFETGTNGWASGGVGDSWAHGTPMKPIVSSAASGTKCWINGGTNGIGYNSNERSFVTSPCFDFTAISNPYVEFKLFWESENGFDGATFQYSTNNGVTWTNVGAASDPVNCLNQNWFNTTNINFINTLANPKEGWSGSIISAGNCGSVNGSGAWLLAKHCMPNLAGLPSVQFRFAFGAGNICNNFDGFAFDDVRIGEAPVNVANFTAACNGSPFSYQFTNTSTPCPTGFTWNFGDPTSANNVSYSQNPTHVFSSPGLYNVTLSIIGPCNAGATYSQTVQVLGANLTAISPNCASSSTGSISTVLINASGSYSYQLQPSGQSNNTGVFANLNANTYTVTVSNLSNCVATSITTITTPTPIIWSNFSINQITCHGANNGSVQATAIGGSGNMGYTILPLGTNSSMGSFTNLSAGQYTVIATDGNGCTISSIGNIIQPNLLQIQSANATPALCNGSSTGSLSVTAAGGSGSLIYLLLPNNVTSSNGVFLNLLSGSYVVQASDANGCTVTTTMNISQPSPIQITNVITINPSCAPNNNGSIQIFSNGGNGTLNYAVDGNFGINNTINNLIANNYTVVVKDAAGCTSSSITSLIPPPNPIINSTNTNNPLCFGNSNGSIDIVGTGNSPIVEYKIVPGNITQSSGNFNSLIAGMYTVSILDAKGCVSSSVIELIAPDLLTFSSIASLNQDSCGVDYKPGLKAIVSGGTAPYLFRLLPGGLQNVTGVFSGLTTGAYVLQITDKNMCTTQSNYSIQEQICCGELFLPSAFSPNNDGRNDEFRLVNSLGIELKSFQIINRWGQIILSTQNPFESWDGKYKGLEAEIGTYYYQVRYKCTLTGKELYKKGDFHLIR